MQRALAHKVPLVVAGDSEDKSEAAVRIAVFRAAGGTHQDWPEFDSVMAAERRCAAFVRAERISSNAG